MATSPDTAFSEGNLLLTSTYYLNEEKQKLEADLKVTCDDVHLNIVKNRISIIESELKRRESSIPLCLFFMAEDSCRPKYKVYINPDMKLSDLKKQVSLIISVTKSTDDPTRNVIPCPKLMFKGKFLRHEGEEGEEGEHDENLDKLRSRDSNNYYIFVTAE